MCTLCPTYSFLFHLINNLRDAIDQDVFVVDPREAVDARQTDWRDLSNNGAVEKRVVSRQMEGVYPAAKVKDRYLQPHGGAWSSC
jgi:hypothetical protein